MTNLSCVIISFPCWAGNFLLLFEFGFYSLKKLDKMEETLGYLWKTIYGVHRGTIL